MKAVFWSIILPVWALLVACALTGLVLVYAVVAMARFNNPAPPPPVVSVPNHTPPAPPTNTVCTCADVTTAALVRTDVLAPVSEAITLRLRSTGGRADDEFTCGCLPACDQ